ncbi:MAG: mechanosensitive ion channel, partial [Lentisphaeraceae bacterium]|nr:mechanosensitive ion channel [Lentisphaeraceae bacterium]
INVAFGSNIEKVKEILLQIGEEHENALEEPPPMVVFSNIGTHSYLFELKVFVSASKYRLSTRDEILAKIIDEFKKEDIQIPYPKSVLQLHSEKTDK